MGSTVQKGEVVVDASHLAEQDIAHSEHVATVLRLRRLSVIGLVGWVLFGFVDIFVLTLVHPGRWWVYLLVRVMGLLVLGFAALRLSHQPSPSIRQLRWIDMGAFLAISILVSVTCAEAGGISSSLVLGVVVLLVARGALSADHWRRALLPVLLVVLAHPLTLLALASISPTIAAQFLDLGNLGLFALNQLFLVGAGALTLAGGHSLWTLQRKVFETRSLGRYRLLELIGKGGMGEVWAAHHRTLNRKVAVKILRGDKVDPKAVARFEREVQATAELTHPNTIRVFDFGATEDGLFYYAMELLDGHDLGQILKKEGALAPRRAVRLLTQAAQALAEAHARGIVHRDIKPGNLFVSKMAGSGELVKVLDFGLVLFRRNDEVELTQEGFAVGTPTYISPEILKGDQADARSDVYALGCVLYQTLMGKPPFAHQDLLEVMRCHLEQVPSPLPARVPESLQKLVMRCLAKDPARRFQDAASLATALATLPMDAPRQRKPAAVAAVAASAGVRVSKPKPLTRLKTPKKRPARRRSVEPAVVVSGTIDTEHAPDDPKARGKVVAFRPPVPSARARAARHEVAPIIPMDSFRKVDPEDADTVVDNRAPSYEPEDADTLLDQPTFSRG
ncbi:MAG: serine/threonine protein kinase [Deltaproteobacteria bacterium]|nr:serine/threonine protein kinase [Deltaproteobacteria bacterium]